MRVKELFAAVSYLGIQSCIVTEDEYMQVCEELRYRPKPFAGWAALLGHFNGATTRLASGTKIQCRYRTNVVSRALYAHMRQIITFDLGGVSGHPNHCSVALAAINFAHSEGGVNSSLY